MKCINCGKELPEGSRFCAGCGSAQIAPQSAPQPAPQPMPQPVPQPMPQPAPAPAAKQPPKWLVIALIAVAVAGIWFFFIRKDPVKDVKEHVFLQYGVVSLETITDVLIPGANWTSTKLSDTSYTVTASGISFIDGGEYRSFTFSVNYLGGAPVVKLIAFSYDSYRTTDEYELNNVMDALYTGYANYLFNGW